MESGDMSEDDKPERKVIKLVERSLVKTIAGRQVHFAEQLGAVFDAAVELALGGAAVSVVPSRGRDAAPTGCLTWGGSQNLVIRGRPRFVASARERRVAAAAARAPRYLRPSQPTIERALSRGETAAAIEAW
jgi:hypothetical protein